MKEEVEWVTRDRERSAGFPYSCSPEADGHKTHLYKEVTNPASLIRRCPEQPDREKEGQG